MTEILIGIGAILASLAGAFFAGRRGAQNKSALDAAERAVKAEGTRRKVEDEIADDPDLAARARRVGLVRPRD